MATNETAIYHIDCTYKMFSNRFPVLIFGRSDKGGRFSYGSMSLEPRNKRRFRYVLQAT